MKETLFTLDEANQALPLVRAITQDAVRRYARVKHALRVQERLQEALHPDAEAIAAQDLVIEEHLRRLRRLVDELESLGCRLRDYERGYVDFPAAVVDETPFLYYSWALGETSVTFWHGEEEGYEQRHALEPAAAPRI